MHLRTACMYALTYMIRACVQVVECGSSVVCIMFLEESTDPVLFKKFRMYHVSFFHNSVILRLLFNMVVCILIRCLFGQTQIFFFFVLWHFLQKKNRESFKNGVV